MNNLNHYINCFSALNTMKKLGEASTAQGIQYVKATQIYFSEPHLKHLLSPLYPAYEMQQRESVYAFAIDNQHHTFVGECL